MNLLQVHYKCHQQPRREFVMTGLLHVWPPTNIHKLVVQQASA